MGSVNSEPNPHLPPGQRLTELLDGRCRAPFEILGIHRLGEGDEGGVVLRAFLPWASEASEAGPSVIDFRAERAAFSWSAMMSA